MEFIMHAILPDGDEVISDGDEVASNSEKANTLHFNKNKK